MLWFVVISLCLLASADGRTLSHRHKHHRAHVHKKSKTTTLRSIVTRFTLPHHVNTEKKSCIYEGEIRNHGEAWSPGPCIPECHCMNGHVKCSNLECPDLNCANSIQKKWKCCPECPPEEQNGACGVRTEKGNANSTCCSFPFKFQDVMYYTCTYLHYNKPWCAATPDFDKDGVWGECIDDNHLSDDIHLNDETLDDHQSTQNDSNIEKTPMRILAKEPFEENVREADVSANQTTNQTTPAKATTGVSEAAQANSTSAQSEATPAKLTAAQSETMQEDVATTQGSEATPANTTTAQSETTQENAATAQGSKATAANTTTAQSETMQENAATAQGSKATAANTTTAQSEITQENAATTQGSEAPSTNPNAPTSNTVPGNATLPGNENTAAATSTPSLPTNNANTSSIPQLIPLITQIAAQVLRPLIPQPTPSSQVVTPSATPAPDASQTNSNTTTDPLLLVPPASAPYYDALVQPNALMYPASPSPTVQTLTIPLPYAGFSVPITPLGNGNGNGAQPAQAQNTGGGDEAIIPGQTGGPQLTLHIPANAPAPEPVAPRPGIHLPLLERMVKPPALIVQEEHRKQLEQQAVEKLEKAEGTAPGNRQQPAAPASVPASSTARGPYPNNPPLPAGSSGVAIEHQPNESFDGIVPPFTTTATPFVWPNITAPCGNVNSQYGGCVYPTATPVPCGSATEQPAGCTFPTTAPYPTPWVWPNMTAPRTTPWVWPNMTASRTTPWVWPNMTAPPATRPPPSAGETNGPTTIAPTVFTLPPVNTTFPPKPDANAITTPPPYIWMSVTEYPLVEKVTTTLPPKRPDMTAPTTATPFVWANMTGPPLNTTEAPVLYSDQASAAGKKPNHVGLLAAFTPVKGPVGYGPNSTDGTEEEEGSAENSTATNETNSAYGTASYSQYGASATSNQTTTTNGGTATGYGNTASAYGSVASVPSNGASSTDSDKSAPVAASSDSAAVQLQPQDPHQTTYYDSAAGRASKTASQYQYNDPYAWNSADTARKQAEGYNKYLKDFYNSYVSG